ncbi:diguanylate cyclase [Zooshikella harenae]|uniref:diguanylate cyclase n=1 Tax=Zooshikella harenae TaxID=2827238 RepID=A0ABS5ZA38_9GAMM|nr:diguanylate cyclase [Zooshikella harenae]MBU2710927.1 diguanylate cyclase [Zooshikella harenae]
MTEQVSKESIQKSTARLKDHFAQRVTNRARQVIECWHRINVDHWTKQWLEEFNRANEKLLKYAKRFDQEKHAHIAEQISDILQNFDSNSIPNSDTIRKLNHLISTLSHTALRKGDSNAKPTSIPSTKPVYIGMNHPSLAGKLLKQMDYFGIRAKAFFAPRDFLNAYHARHPAVIVMDVDFGRQRHAGIDLIKKIQAERDNPFPVLFYSHDIDDIRTRLEATRAFGCEFYTRGLEIGHIIDRIEQLTRVVVQDPYRVLIVDDSKAQAYFTQNTLNKAGIITEVITKPLEVLDALEKFDADLIILDMYMPECNGMELAKVIRQQEKYVSIPIIYLSAEADVDKQLIAMSEGGDDFLTKPIKPHHLISTVRNRGERARALLSRMIRDSLTGLYNHTYTLQQLQNEILRSEENQTPLAFAMIDIDHFKSVNDTYGHPMGDRVIKSLALFLKQRLRKTDTVGRYGGEEFAVILPNTQQENALALLDDIRTHFAQLRQPAHPEDLQVTFSCGVAMLTEDNTEMLSSQADQALYDAKHAGRNCVRIYTPPEEKGSPSNKPVASAS